MASFVTAISALIVYLFAFLGVSPKDVIDARAVNTVVGGAMALAAYGLWPTWERTQVSEAMAAMLDSYRDYYAAIGAWFLNPEAPPSADLDHKRVAARLARSNMEASFERLSAEPGVSRRQIDLIGNMLASSHRLAHAMMALESAAVPNHARRGPTPVSNVSQRRGENALSAFRRIARSEDALQELPRPAQVLPEPGRWETRTSIATPWST